MGFKWSLVQIQSPRPLKNGSNDTEKWILGRFSFTRALSEKSRLWSFNPV